MGPVGPMVGVQVLRPILGQLARHGIGAVEFLAEYDLRPELLDEPDRLIPFPGPFMWERAAELAGDAAFGLHAAENVEVESFDVFSYVLAAAPTVRESLSRVGRYVGLLTNFVGYELREERARVTFEYQSQLPPCRIMDQFAVTVPHRYGRLFARDAWRLVGVSFRHPALDGDPAEYERVFGAPVEFEASLDGIHFELPLLDEPLHTKDPRLLAILDKVALDWLSRMPAGNSFAQRVRAEVTSQCHGGHVELETCARRLGVSARSLQRRLRLENCSFHQIVDEVRRALSAKYLSTGLSLAEISFLLGFSDRAVFHRAFKRWSGTTPEAFRHVR
jgi:AraC-like DNA-binding protein